MLSIQPTSASVASVKSNPVSKKIRLKGYFPQQYGLRTPQQIGVKKAQNPLKKMLVAVGKIILGLGLVTFLFKAVKKCLKGLFGGSDKKLSAKSQEKTKNPKRKRQHLGKSEHKVSKQSSSVVKKLKPVSPEEAALQDVLKQLDQVSNSKGSTKPVNNTDPLAIIQQLFAQQENLLNQQVVAQAERPALEPVAPMTVSPKQRLEELVKAYDFNQFDKKDEAQIVKKVADKYGRMYENSPHLRVASVDAYHPVPQLADYMASSPDKSFLFNSSAKLAVKKVKQYLDIIKQTVQEAEEQGQLKEQDLKEALIPLHDFDANVDEKALNKGELFPEHLSDLSLPTQAQEVAALIQQGLNGPNSLHQSLSPIAEGEQQLLSERHGTWLADRIANVNPDKFQSLLKKYKVKVVPEAKEHQALLRKIGQHIQQDAVEQKRVIYNDPKLYATLALTKRIAPAINNKATITQGLLDTDAADDVGLKIVYDYLTDQLDAKKNGLSDSLAKNKAHLAHDTLFAYATGADLQELLDAEKSLEEGSKQVHPAFIETLERGIKHFAESTN